MSNETNWDLRRPLGTKSFWVLFGGLLLWTLFLGVILRMDFGLDPASRDAAFRDSVWALLIGSWVVGVAAFMLRSAFDAQPAPAPFRELRDSMWQECHAMAQYALERGKTPEPEDLRALQAIAPSIGRIDDPGRALTPTQIRELAAAHQRLAALVAPAMPKTLALLSFGAGSSSAPGTFRPGSLAWLGQVRLVRMMLGVAIVLLPMFVALALAVGTRLSSSAGLFAGDLVDRLQTAAYLVVASALGAAFASLYKARRYIESLSYDDQYESSYWVRFVQGLLAGLILAVLLSQTLPTDAGDTEETSFRLGVPLLALIGGFSSDLVYRILRRIIEAVETLFQGGIDDKLDAEAERQETRLRLQKLESEHLLTAKVTANVQAEIAALLQVREKLPSDGSAAAARSEIDRRITKLLSEIRDGRSLDPLALETDDPTDPNPPDETTDPTPSLRDE
jgi:hypothetical protein